MDALQVDPPLRFCINCAYYRSRAITLDFSTDDMFTCEAPGNIKGKDLVTGKDIYWFKNCKEVREWDSVPNQTIVPTPPKIRCGRIGSWYVEKHSPTLQSAVPTTKKRTLDLGDL